MEYMKPSKLFYHPDRIAQYLQGQNVLPITVKLYLTERCNLACGYCVYKDRISKEEMTRENFSKILRALIAMGIKGITLTGGEPTMHPKFEKLVAEARANDIDVGLITNGVVRQPIEDLTWVRFSVDTVNKRTYKLIKGKDYAEKVMETIDEAITEKKAKKLKTTIGVQMVVTDDNYSRIKEFVDYFANRAVDYCQIRPVENAEYKEGALEWILMTIKELKKEKYSAKVIFTDYKWDEIKNGYKKSYPGCPGAPFIGAVGVNGDFYICCTWMKEPKALYGNLIKEDPIDILNNRKKVLQEFDHEACPVGCQGSNINKFLHGLKFIKHRNFI